MPDSHGFEEVRKQEIPELRTRGILYRHKKTGAELLSLINDDENKVFGITFRTPPNNSTGVAHILEHSVLCGSRKYPVKEPFVELLKGSLHTFLNAMTFPDKTSYPVASQNVKDFYNLIDVYLDAVFYPRITPFIFKQEGWHLELKKPDGEMTYRGVVYNEMKGAYSSPDSLVAEYSQESLFPHNPYGFDSGGKPSEITNLTYQDFKDFHRKYYHPSNARIFFYGDDDPQQRLSLVNDYLKDFDRMEAESPIPLQRPFDQPRRITRSYASGKDEADRPKGMVTVNWLLCESTEVEQNLALHILSYALLGMPGSPLRKALIESGWGEDIVGVGLEAELRQIYFSTGLKGIDIRNTEKIEDLVFETLTGLVKKGIDPRTVEAAVNTIEFRLRENNAGNLPQGLVLMLRALTTWLYDHDPMALLAFERPLANVKTMLDEQDHFFERLIERYFLNNPHRTTVILKPDPKLAEAERQAERERLNSARSAMGAEQLKEVIRTTKELKEIQEEPDSPEALATIPSLRLEDLDTKNKVIPLERREQGGTVALYHDLFTNGILYMDVGFNLHVLPQRLLPYVHIFGKALLEMGTEKEDYVSLAHRISRLTGGITPAFFTSEITASEQSAAWIFLRGKAIVSRAEHLMHIFQDILQHLRLDNSQRFKQILLESLAREEQKLAPSGHQIVNLRLRAEFSEADWAAEQINGLSQVFFLRELVERVNNDWASVLADLEEIRHILINRQNMIINVTLDGESWSKIEHRIEEFPADLSQSAPETFLWSSGRIPAHEGFSMPGQVNYVGKGAPLYHLGYRFHGSSYVISRFLRNAWLWDRIRVQGGAYGAFCLLDRLSGILTFLSYRDPNVEATLQAFDESVGFLKDTHLGQEEIAKSIIGTIGDMDRYMLPDQAGYTSMLRYLRQESEQDRQKVRDEVFATESKHFKDFADILEQVKEQGIVKLLGPPSILEDLSTRRPGGLKITRVL